MTDRPASTAWTDAVLRVIRRAARHVLRVLYAVLDIRPGRAPGEVVSTGLDAGALSVEGWVHRRPADIDSVIVYIDQQPVGLAQLGPAEGEQPHRDPALPVDATLWRCVVTTADLSSGQHLVEAAVVSRRGVYDRLFGQLFQVPEPEGFPIGKIDAPLPHQEQVSPPIVRFRGWVRHDLGYTGVELRLSTGEHVDARIMSEYRPDLGVLHEPLAPLGGWECWIPIPERLVGTEFEVTVDAVGPALRTELGSRTVSVVPRAPVGGSVDGHRVAQLVARTADVVATGRRAEGRARPTVLVATHSLGLGGGQLYLQELLRQFLARHEFDLVVVAQYDGGLREELESAGVKVHVCGPPPGRATDYEAFVYELALVAAVDRPDAVIANTAGVFWGVDLASRLDVPSVWAIHESFEPAHYLEVGPAHSFDEYVRSRFFDAFARASAVVYEARQTERLFAGVTPSGRSVTVDYGLDLAKIDAERAAADRSALRREHGIGENAVVILCIGTIEPRKAQAALVTAFDRASKAHRRDAPDDEVLLCLVGDFPSPYSDGIHALVDRLGCADRVRIEPVTPRTHAWYAMADAYALASDVESLPMSVLEAMAFEMPVVCSAVFGLCDLIIDGKNGFLFDPTKLDGIETALANLLKLGVAERTEIGRNARDTVVSRGDSSRYARSYAALVRALIADPATDLSAVLAAVPDGAPYAVERAGASDQRPGRALR